MFHLISFMLKISAPGKLFLSGEWAVLEVGNPGIVTAVNKRVFAEIEDADKISVSVDDFNINNICMDYNYQWETFDQAVKEKLMFIRGAIETTQKYLDSNKSFKLRSWGEQSQIEEEYSQVHRVAYEGIDTRVY